MTKQNRRAVVVLGMHRSGTSAVAGTAVRLGAAAPRTPLPPSGDNPEGFFESHPVVLHNYHMMLAGGAAWNVCLGFEPSSLPAAGAPLPVLTEVLRQEFGAAGLFVLKDPRLCLTMPAWLPALRAEYAAPAMLIVCRHPAEVASSLRVRNGFAPEATAAIWLHHMLEAEHVSRGFPRAVIFYDDLLTDWRRAMTEAGRAAALDWPLSFAAAAGGVDRFLAPALRHHRATRESAGIGVPPVGELVEAAWLAFHGLRQDPGSALVQSCFDHVRSRFAAWRLVAHPPDTTVTWTAN